MNYEHIPKKLLIHQLLGIANCRGATQLIDSTLRCGWSLDAQAIACPVRIAWGDAERVTDLEYRDGEALHRQVVSNHDHRMTTDELRLRLRQRKASSRRVPACVLEAVAFTVQLPSWP